MMPPKDMSNAEILMRLFNRSKQQGFGLLLPEGKNPMTLRKAQIVVASGDTYFDYLYGRVMKIDISKRPLDVRLYERDNGVDSVLDALTMPIPEELMK